MQSVEAVQYIADHPGATPVQVADHLHVSVRTLRSYIKRANATLEEIASIQLARGAGYSIEINNPSAFQQWLVAASKAPSMVPQTPRERVAYLLNDLCSRSTWITLDELSDMLFCSKSVLSGDIKNVERTLGEFDLKLVRRPHYGMRVEGSEFSRRLCLAASMMDSERAGDESASASLIKAGPEALVDPAQRRYVLQTIAKNVDEVIESHDFHINPVSYQNLLVHIAIALLRIQSGHYVPMETVQFDRIRDSIEYPIALEIAHAIDRELDVALPDEEVAYLAIHLAGKQALWSPSDEDKDSVISDEIWDVISEILDKVWLTFRIDFRSDIELRMNLARHIVPLTVRLRYHMDLSNPMLEDIKARYLLAWSIAVEAGEILASHYGSPLSEDEAGYLALAFALALERQKTAPAKKNILVVCATGAGSARLLEYRCRREFGEYVDKIVTCDVFGIDRVDLANIDYVFTTVPLGRSLPVPVREVTYFFDDDEVAEVKKLLGREEAGFVLGEYFDPRLFFPHQTWGSKEEVLHAMCERLREEGMVDEGIEELVLAREGMTATSYGNNVAMPHPLEPAGDRTIIAVALLDKPVVWDERGTAVQAVFLISYARQAGRALDGLFSSLADLFMDEGAIAYLVHNQTWASLEYVAGSIGLQNALD